MPPKGTKQNVNVRAAVKNRKRGDLEVWVEKLMRGELSTLQWLSLVVMLLAVVGGVMGARIVFGSKVRTLSPSE